MAYFWAARPVMGLFAVLLCLAGFRLQAELVHYQWWQLALCSAITFVSCSFAMLRNDFDDRARDVLKGKRLAYDNPERFYKIVFRLGIILGFSVGFLDNVNNFVKPVALLIVILSVLYATSYKRPTLPMMIVALCSAYPALFGLMVNPRHILSGATLFLIVFLAIGAREILKDIEDAEGDIGYKATLPVWLGTDRSQIVASGLLCLAAALVVFCWQISLRYWTALLIVSCALLIFPLSKPKIGKWALDITFVFVLSEILLGYLGP